MKTNAIKNYFKPHFLSVAFLFPVALITTNEAFSSNPSMPSAKVYEDGTSAAVQTKRGTRDNSVYRSTVQEGTKTVKNVRGNRTETTIKVETKNTLLNYDQAKRARGLRQNISLPHTTLASP